MNDLISRRATIDALDKEYRCTDRSDDWDGLKTAMLIIENLPSAQPERKKGKWIKDIERFGDNSYHCSQCGAVLEKDDLEWRNNYYCYHCGLDMRGE